MDTWNYFSLCGTFYSSWIHSMENKMVQKTTTTSISNSWTKSTRMRESWRKSTRKWEKTINCIKVQNNIRYYHMTHTCISPACTLLRKRLQKVTWWGLYRLTWAGPKKPVQPWLFLCAILWLVFQRFALFMTEKSGHMINCLLTELGQARWENIWLLVICCVVRTA